LLAAGEDDLARVAVGDELDRAPQNEPLLFAALELALRDRRRDELAAVVAKLIALDEPVLRSALRFVLGVRDDDTSHVARLERIWSSRTDAGTRMLELSYHIERDDPLVAAAVAVRATSFGASREAAELAVRAAPRDPIACRLAAETLLASGDPATAHAFARWARCRSGATERAYAAARAAELDPALGRLWAQVLDLDPDDDYAAAQLRVVQPERVGELGMLAREPQIVNAAWELVRAGRNDAALALFEAPSTSWAMREAHAEALARNARWSECAEILEALAEAPGLLARSVILYRAALARTEATRLEANADKARELIALAIAAWRRVLESDPASPVADGLSIALAMRLDDEMLVDDVLARTAKSERSPWTASSLTLRRARRFLTSDPERAYEIAKSASTTIDDPRRYIVMLLAVVAARRFDEVPNILEERARQREGTDEAVISRLRAALLLMARGDQARAHELVASLEPIIPDLVRDLVAPERRRPVQSFAQLLRDAEEAESRADHAGALQRYMSAIALRPGNAHAIVPMLRIAARLRQTAPIVVHAKQQLAAPTADTAAQADAHEWLARIERERGSSTAADDHIERVLAIEPGRTDLHVWYACKLGREARFADLMQLRERQVADTPDSAALLSEIARLAIRGEQLSNDTFARLLREPPDRLALMYVEHALVPKQRAQPLAALAQQISEIFEDAPSRAAYTTRAADLLDTLGMRTETIALCRRALELAPAYSPALIVWQRAALVGEQWRELAMALAMRGGTTRDVRGASLFHLAGVVLMDKLDLHEQAANALSRALELDPNHIDALLRLRLLDERIPGSTPYAKILADRVAATTDPGLKLELFRLQAEEARRTGDRDAALRHCRSMIALAPADVRVHAAMSDIASEGSSREQAIAAIEARIAVERDFLILHSLNDRLGRLQAEHDAKAAVAAFQQAAMYRPDDLAVIERLAELAVRVKEWNIARSAIDRLLAHERSAEKQVRYLRAAATVQLRGFRDHAKAELHLRRAFELAPTDTENMRALVTLRAEAGESSSLRAYLDNTVQAMRTQASDGSADAYTFGLLASVLSLRAQLLGEDTHLAARAAAEAADVLGMRNPELLATQPAAHFVGARVDESLFAGTRQPRALELLVRMRDAVAKQSADLGLHGVGRRERLKHEHPAATMSIGLASSLGIERLEVYASTRDPFRFIVEPTSTPSLVLGESIASADLLRVRCAAGAALKLAQLGLAIPSRMSVDDLGVLVAAIVSLARPDLATDTDAVRALARSLRKHVTQAQLDAMASIVPERIEIEELARDIRSITWRAAFRACGSLRATLQLFVDIAGIDLQHGLVHEQGRGVVTYALST
jgi:tetratricopeptide (TPR) repeat protein